METDWSNIASQISILESNIICCRNRSLTLLSRCLELHDVLKCNKHPIELHEFYGKCVGRFLSVTGDITCFLSQFQSLDYFLCCWESNTIKEKFNYHNVSIAHLMNDIFVETGTEFNACSDDDDFSLDLTEMEVILTTSFLEQHMDPESNIARFRIFESRDVSVQIVTSATAKT